MALTRTTPRGGDIACSSSPASPWSRDVRRHRSKCCHDPRCVRAAGRTVGRDRVAPAVSRHHGQRAGAGVRSGHSRLDATTTASAQAIAEPPPGALNNSGAAPEALQTPQGDLTAIAGFNKRPRLVRSVSRRLRRVVSGRPARRISGMRLRRPSRAYGPGKSVGSGWPRTRCGTSRRGVRLLASRLSACHGLAADTTGIAAAALCHRRRGSRHQQRCHAENPHCFCHGSLCH
jgi:hypothetical protein